MRSGEVVIRMLANVKQATIKPLIVETVTAGTLVYSDEYNIYSQLEAWGYAHKTVNHGSGEYAVTRMVTVSMKFTSTPWKVLVTAALMVTPASGYLTRKAAVLPCVL